MEDEEFLIRWQATTLHRQIVGHLDEMGLERFDRHLEAGSGPAVHHLFALEKYSSRIELTDFLPGNLEEIRKWVRGSDAAHDWRPFVSRILAAEGVPPTDELVARREQLVRSKIAAYGPLDLKKPTEAMRSYSAPLVTSFFVADSATGDREQFKEMTRNAFDLVTSGGLFIAAYLGGCERYRVGDKWVVSANVTRRDIEEAFDIPEVSSLSIERFDTPTLAHEGFDHIFAVLAKGA